LIKNYIIPVRVNEKDIPDNFNTKLLGTWALDEHDLGNRRKLEVLDYHYNDYNSLFSDFEYTKKLYKELLPIVGNLMNEHHSLNWNNRGFKIFYGAWLLTYLEVIRDRHEAIRCAINKNPSYKFILTKNILTISSLEDFKKKITQDDYNHFLYSKIVKFIDRKKYEEAYFLAEKKIYEKNEPFFSKKKLLNFLLKYFQKFLNFLTKKSKGAIDRSYFSNINFLEFIIKTFPKITPIIFLPKIIDKPKSINLSIRTELALKLKDSYLTKNNFEEYVVRNLFNDLPLDYIENFKEILIASNFINIKDKNYLSTNAILSNQILQCSIADQLGRHKKLIIAQHGGSYGTAKWSSPEFFELDLADKYLTFGWSNKKYSNTLSISHPKLIMKNFKKKVLSDRVLYISQGPSRYLNRNWSHPIAGDSILKYYQNILIFINNLDSSLNSNLRMRLAPSDIEYKIGIKEYLADYVSFSTGDFYDELQKTSLVICDHNQTTFLESLAANKPTIIIWDLEYTKINDECIFFLNELAKVGVFHNSHEEASNYLNKILTKGLIQDWWINESRQYAVNLFVKKYAKRNKNWVSDYQKILFS